MSAAHWERTGASGKPRGTCERALNLNESQPILSWLSARGWIQLAPLARGKGNGPGRRGRRGRKKQHGSAWLSSRALLVKKIGKKRAVHRTIFIVGLRLSSSKLS